MNFENMHSPAVQPTSFSRNSFLHFTRLFLIGLTIFVANNTNAQQIADQSGRNAVYIDVSSTGALYSINYDRIFRQGEKLDYSFNVGFFAVKNSIAFPLGIHFLTTTSDHHLEYGVTFIPVIEQKPALVGSPGKGDKDKYLYINPGIGYRYQKRGAGVFIKALIGPSVFLDPPSDDFWKMDPKLRAFASFGIGISF